MDDLVLIYLELLNSIANLTLQNIVALIAIAGGIFSIIASFVTWRIDRGRLSSLEGESEKMKIDLEKHEVKTENDLKDIRESMYKSNETVIAKIDELKMFLLNSKITWKGEAQKQDREGI